jgi:Zn-finger nucleic acid-binding protein
MRSYERNGITIDQCTECRGVFLDRGELDHLISMESAQAPAAATPPVQQQPQQPPQTQYPQQGYQGGYQQGGYQGGYQQQYGKPYKKKKSFLEELFD